MVAFLNIVSSPGPGLVRLVTRWVKTRFGQVGDKVSQVKDQVGQGQGQELNNTRKKVLLILSIMLSDAQCFNQNYLLLNIPSAKGGL